MTRALKREKNQIYIASGRRQPGEQHIYKRLPSVRVIKSDESYKEAWRSLRVASRIKGKAYPSCSVQSCLRTIIWPLIYAIWELRDRCQKRGRSVPIRAVNRLDSRQLSSSTPQLTSTIKKKQRTRLTVTIYWIEIEDRIGGARSGWCSLVVGRVKVDFVWSTIWALRHYDNLYHDG